MGFDYYTLLEITPSASDADIKKAFRKLAIRYHPRKSSGDEIQREKFYLICEAYDVLSDACKRATYDQFGEEGLKKGVPTGSMAAGAWTKGYTFHGDVMKVFRDFFGGDNPYQEYYDKVDGDLVMGFGGLKGYGAKKQSPVEERDLWLTLEEIFHGCTKKMKICKKMMAEDGKTSEVKEKILTITIKRGWKQGTRITFPREGDQGPNNIPADIIFILRDKEHPDFRREGNNLIHIVPISLNCALTGATIEIHTVDERIIHVPITEVVRPGYTKTVVSEGMPLPSNPDTKGDMIIHFDIRFPGQLKHQRKELIKKALPKNVKNLCHDQEGPEGLI